MHCSNSFEAGLLSFKLIQDYAEVLTKNSTCTEAGATVLGAAVMGKCVNSFSKVDANSVVRYAQPASSVRMN